MAFESKDKDQLVDDVATSILAQLPDLDFSDGEPIRTIIEAVMAELDLQYWQLQQIYDNSFIDTAYGDDLTNLVKLLGVTRIPALQSSGEVKFYRETPATQDYAIPIGTLVETIPDAFGNVIQFETTENATLLTGQTFIYVKVQSVDFGLASNVVINKIVVINDPPLGIESVTNEEAIIGGEDEETDDNLKERASLALESSGLGTISAIESKIATTPGVKTVKVLDMARGIGTMDILVLGDIVPMPSDKITEISNVVQETKAGGIDFNIIEPTQSVINVSVTLSLMDGITTFDTNIVSIAIQNYFSSLKIGDSFIINQLSRKILESSDDIKDITSITPSVNTLIDELSIIVQGTINVVIE